MGARNRRLEHRRSGHRHGRRLQPSGPRFTALGEHARLGRRGRRRRQRPRRRLERLGLRERRQRPVRRQPARDACLGHHRRRGGQRRGRRRCQLEREDHGAEVPELRGVGDDGGRDRVHALRGGPRRRRLLELVGWRALRAGPAGRDRVRRFPRHALRGRGRQRRLQQRRHADISGDVRLRRRPRRGRDRSQRRSCLLLELRGQDRRSRSPRRRHPLDDAGQLVRILRRDLDGHAACGGSGRSRRGQVPGGDALRDQGAAHELGGSRRRADREDGDWRPAQHRKRPRLRQPGEGRAERPRQRLRRGRERHHPDQGPGCELRSSGRNRKCHGNRQRNSRGVVGGESRHRSVHGELCRQRAGSAFGYGER